MQRFPKGSTDKTKCESLARTLVDEYGWVVNTEAIRKAGLDGDGDPVITVLVHSPCSNAGRAILRHFQRILFRGGLEWRWLAYIPA